MPQQRALTFQVQMRFDVARRVELEMVELLGVEPAALEARLLLVQRHEWLEEEGVGFGVVELKHGRVRSSIFTRCAIAVRPSAQILRVAGRS